MPDRCPRQFGRVQRIPRPVIEPLKAHRLKNIRCYSVFYDANQWLWESRDVHSLSLDDMGPVAYAPHECSHDYMDWYIKRTHRYIRPAIPGMITERQVILIVLVYLAFLVFVCL